MENRIIRTGIIVIVLASILVSIMVLVSLKPFMTGFISSEETYTDKINVVAKQYTEYVWQPEETGQLISLKASGEISGEGSARIYIENNDETYLIYDSEKGKNMKNVLTGLTLSPDPDENDDSSEDDSPSDDSEASDETPADEPSDEEPSEEPSEEIDEEELPEEITEEELPDEQPEDQPEEIDENITEEETNETEEINETAENIVDENITEEEAEIGGDEEILPEEEITIEFDDVCIETCTLEGFNQSSYKIIIEVDDDTILKLNKLIYTISLDESLTEINLTNVTDIEYEMIQEDEEIDAVIDSIEYDNETQTLNVAFHHESKKREPIAIISDSYIDYNLDKMMSIGNENVTLTVYDWDPEQYFEIKIGQHSQIIGIGDVPEYDFDATVKDADGEAINATVEFVKPVSKEIKKEIAGKAEKDKVQKGKYDINIMPEEGPINEISINEVNVNSSINNLIDIDKNIFVEGYVQSYAIDPTVMPEFTNATVTVTAKGNELWKCKDWNFAEQTCYGAWEKVMDITPGQDYSFELTPEDPGYGEIVIIKAEHLDADYNFMSDIYDETRYMDGDWSEKIYENEFVRLTFDKNITDSNTIYVYARGDGNSHFEVYEKGAAYPLIGRSVGYGGTTDEIGAEGWYQVDVENLIDPEDDFDFKIVNTGAETGWIEFDYIEDPGDAMLSFEGMNFSIWNSSSWTWNSGTLVCSVALSDTDATISTCSPGSIKAGTTYRVQVEIKNPGTENAKWKNDAQSYVKHVGVKGAGRLFGTNPTLVNTAGCVVYDYDGDNKNGNIACSVSWDGNNVSITNPIADEWKADIGDYEGFMYLIAPDTNAVSNDTSYWYSQETQDDYIQQSSRVNVSVGVLDTTPPAAVTNLQSPSKGTSWIYWTWTNPVSDFSQAIVYLNGVWKVNTSNNYYNATGLNENTDYTITVRTKDAAGNVNNTDVNSTIKTLSACTENWTVQYGNCLINDTQLKYYIDENECGTTNDLPGDNGTYAACNYCSYNVANSSWSSWHDITECLPGDYHTQERNLTEYDSNYSTCYLVTTLPSDLWNSGNNNTYYEYQNLTCDYCTPNLVNTTWSSWYNATSCRENDTLTQEKNLTQYDENNCGEVENTTFYEYQDIMCDYNGAPVITIHSPLNEEEYLPSPIDLDVSANEAVQEWWYDLNGGANVTFAPNTTINGIKGPNTLIVYANDSFGNIGYQQVSFTVLGILSAEFTEPSGNPTYYEGQDIILQSYVYDEFDNAIENADVTFELINDTYTYDCVNVIDIGNGYYNCALDTSGMQTPKYYDIRINASKDGYYNGTSTEEAFMLEDNQEANLTLQKSANVVVLNSTTIVYEISNMLTNAKGTSQSTNLTDPDAQTWNLGDIGAETIFENYTLSYTRGQSTYNVTLNSSTAEGYDPIYEKSLHAESDQSIIVIPENDAVVQLTLIKNINYANQTDTNVTYDVSIDVINSGNRDLHDISVVDADLGISETIDLLESETWNSSGSIVIDKNPQGHTFNFSKTSAYANGTYFYSNQPSVYISGYGGPYDVVVINLPSSVDANAQITGTVEITNQNTEVEEDRTLTTWIEDINGTVYDLDTRTVYVAKNTSVTTQVTLTAPSSSGTYYFVSELIWPTAMANASKSFTVKSKSSGGGDSGDEEGFPENQTEEENMTFAPQSVKKTTPPSAESEIPEDITQDIITLRNTYRDLKESVEQSKARGKDVTNSEELLDELKTLINEIETRTAKGEYDFARNLIENAFNKIIILKAVEGYEPSGKVIDKGQGFNTPSTNVKKGLQLAGLFAFIVLVCIIIVVGMVKKRQEREKTHKREIKKFISSQKKDVEKFEKEIEGKLRRAELKERQEKEVKAFVKEQEKEISKFEREINDKLGKIDLK